MSKKKSDIAQINKLEKTTFQEMFGGGDEELRDVVCCFLASSRSGKTTLLYNLINQISKEYDIILLFTTNSKSGVYSNFSSKDSRIVIIQDMDSRIINALHYLNQECENEYRILVILDDIIDVRQNKVVKQLFSTYRNAHFSTIHSIQYTTYMNKDSRAQCHRFFFGHLNNLDEVRKVCTNYIYGFEGLIYPNGINTKSKKIDYLCEWYMENTKNYNFIVFDNLENKIYSIKSELII